MWRNGRDKMRKVSGNLLFFSIFLLCAGSAIGWAIVSRVSGDQAGTEFLYLSFTLTLLVYTVQVALFFISRDRLFLQIAFISVFGVSLVWFLLSLALPILWFREVSQSVKVSVVMLSVILFCIKGYEGGYCFQRKWIERKSCALEHFNLERQTLDWDEFLKSFRLSYSFLPSRFPAWIERFLTIALFVSMIIGLNLRKAFPVFSVFLWGVPCIIASATLIQIIVISFMQSLKVVELEKTIGMKINAAPG